MKLTTLLAFTAGLYASSAFADSAQDLAIRTYNHLVSYESLLKGAIRSGDRGDFTRFIFRPTLDLQQQWPRLGDPAYDKYARCYFALDGFRVWSEDQFNARQLEPIDTRTYRDYKAQKAECKKALRGKV